MRIIDSTYVQLPKHFDGSFSGLDRLSLDYKNVILSSVENLNKNKFKIGVTAIDGPELKNGYVRFKPNTSQDLIAEIYKTFEISIGQKVSIVYNLSISDINK